tara:strand:- start:56 stop:517 length:462 start_codon:yes stop_codon:yes gene_type:complete
MNNKFNSSELRRMIRSKAGLQQQANTYFTREEMKKIILSINKTIKSITDDSEQVDFIPSENLFPKYLKNIWIKQQTVSSHPVKDNLLAIYEEMSKLQNDESKKSDLELKYTLSSKYSSKIRESLLSIVPSNLLDKAREILITQDNLKISIKLQ